MKAKSKFAAIPYLVWMLIFIIVPLGMVVFFGFTTKGGEFTSTTSPASPNMPTSSGNPSIFR